MGSTSGRRSGLAVFDFPIDEERETRGATRKGRGQGEPSPSRGGVSGIAEQATPPAGRAGGRHVATPRSELFLPAYKRRKQRGLGKDGGFVTAAGGLLEAGRERGGQEAFRGQEIVWPELCPVRHEIVRRTTTAAGPGSEAEDKHVEEMVTAEAVPGGDSGAKLTPQGVDTERFLRSRWAGTSGRLEGGREEGFRSGHGGWGEETPPRISPRQSGGEGSGKEHEENWQGVSKAWAADEATWRIRAPLSAWPYWVYR